MDSGNLHVSWGGTSPWMRVATTTASLADIAVGNFDNAPGADIFVADGTEWKLASAGTTWGHFAWSGFRTKDLRFGDFTGDRKTDVLAFTGGQWQIVAGGGGGYWEVLGPGRTSSMSGLNLTKIVSASATAVRPGSTRLLTASIRDVDAVSDEEFLARERASVEKHELLNGRMIAMAGASPRHVALVTNLAAALTSQLRGRGCRAFASDLRVHVPATGLYTYPDISVVCGEVERAGKDAATIVNPVVLVEVLSESTEAYDRGAKFAHYRSIAALRSHVLVDQMEPRIERYDRMDDGDWRLHDVVGVDAVLELPALGIGVLLGDVYADLPVA